MVDETVKMISICGFEGMLCTSGSVVEYRLAKARVAGSNPVSCSQRDRKKSHPMDGSFFYVQALPGSNGSNVSAPLRSSQSNVPRTFCDVSCSQRDTKKDIRWMALFSMFKPCRARTVRMSTLRSGRRSRTSPGRSATSRAFNDTEKRHPMGVSFFVYSSPAGLERFECLRSTPVVATISNACKT